MTARMAAWPQSRVSWFSPSFMVAVVNGVLTLPPPQVMPTGPRGGEKPYHLVAYAALALATGIMRPKRTISVAALALLYGAAIEMIQPAVGRSAEPGDLLSDGAGITIGIALGLVVGVCCGCGNQIGRDISEAGTAGVPHVCRDPRFFGRGQPWPTP